MIANLIIAKKEELNYGGNYVKSACEACGSHELKRVGNKYICQYCGSKYFMNENEEEINSELTDIQVVGLHMLIML